MAKYDPLVKYPQDVLLMWESYQQVVGLFIIIYNYTGVDNILDESIQIRYFTVNLHHLYNKLK